MFSRLSAASGQSGRTSLDVTCGENQTGGEISGTVVISVASPASSITINIVQKYEYTPTGYLRGNRTGYHPKIEMPFNAYDIWYNSGTQGYMRIEQQADYDRGYLWSRDRYNGWFSLEFVGYAMLDGHSVPVSDLRLGNTTTALNNIFTNTTGQTSTSIFTFSGQNISFENTVTHMDRTGTFSGNLSDDEIIMFYSYDYFDFYRMKFFDSPTGDPIYDLCPALDNNNVPCIFEAVNEVYYYPQDPGHMTFIPFN